MARKARKESTYGIHHCILKCLKDYAYFLTVDDKTKMRDCIRKALALPQLAELYCLAYCIMDNHIHFVFDGNLDLTGTFFRSIGASFGHYVHKKTGADGRFVKGRYFSEPIEGDKQLLNTLAYVLNNPTHLSHIKSAADYEFSSFQFLNLNDDKGDEITANERRRSYISDASLIEVVQEKGDEIKKLDLEGNSRHYLLDDQVYEKLRSMVGRKQAKQVWKMKRRRIGKILTYLLDCGSSMRSLSRVTGISYGDVRKILAEVG